MTDETMPSGLWQETRQAAKAWEQAQSPHGDEPASSGPVVAGQVLTLPELGEPRLAWAALREEGKTERRLLVVADVNPLVGSGDVAVTGPEVGSLTLRCRFAVWASERDLGATTLLGTLPLEALARADSRWQALAAGRPVGTFSEQETEEDPEYQDWIEDVVRPAAGKLEARVSTDSASPSSALPFPTRRPTEPLTSARRGAWMRWAAVLAFVTLGAASGFLWWRQGKEIAGLRAAVAASEAAQRQAISELEARRAALEAQYQARLKEAGEDRARLVSEHRAQMAELEARLAKLRQTTDVKNPMLAVLESADVQRGTKKLTVGPEVSHLVLMLSVNDPAGTEFQIEVSELRSGKQVFVQKGLRAYGIGEVRLGLPAVLVPPGNYRLRLFRKESGKLHLVREHVIEIVPGAKSRPPHE
ncbi:MAG TPA: hypothetical protein VGS07_16530 [Thermoanaerobaculia bacterium]|jgi:hypothetical protein|nr:hypothetical protein [Thermoanaerobaculia bacterium]